MADSTHNLRDILHDEVYPRLSPEQVYTWSGHQWQKAGDRWRGACPWHESKSGTSFVVTLDNMLWYCPTCGGGDPITYLWRLEGGQGSPHGDDFTRIATELASLAGVSLPEPSPEALQRAQDARDRSGALAVVYELCQEYLWTDAGQEARAYLQSRGLSEDAIRDFGLGLYPGARVVGQTLVHGGHRSCPEHGATDALEGYLTVPWHDAAGHPLTLYGRWPSKTIPDGKPKTYALPGQSSKRSPLFLDRALRAGHMTVVLVEGDLDAMVLRSLGASDVCAYLGATPSREQLETLRRRAIEAAMICPDPDAAGDAGVLSFLKNADPGIRTYVAPPLPDGQDPDEFVLAAGIEGWQEHLKGADSGLTWQARGALEEHDLETAMGRDAALSELRELAKGCRRLVDMEPLVSLARRLGMSKTALRADLKQARGGSGAGKQALERQPPEAPTSAADLPRWVREMLGERADREAKLEVAETVARFLLEDGRLLVDLGQDSAQGGRPYLVSDDGAAWPLEPDAVQTRFVLHTLGLNGSEPSYRFVLEHLHMRTLERGLRVTLARWQEPRDTALYVSCGPHALVRVRGGALERLPNGADDVWFAGDGSYPLWEPTTPVDPTTLAAFCPCLEMPTEVPTYTASAQRTLIGAFLAALLSGLRPLPLFLPMGPKGGGKSNVAKAALRMLLGPAASPSIPGQDVRDYWSLVTSRPLVLYDNLDGVPPVWFPDVIAATITGAADQRRELYTDSNVIDRPATAALAITTRTASFARPDIAERCLPLLTGEFEDANRLADSELMDAITTNRSGLLSWCALEAAHILQERNKAPAGLPLRFVDFARLVWAYVQRRNEDKDAVPIDAADLLLSLRQAQAVIVGEGDPLVEAILGHFDALPVNEEGWWRGNAGDLTRALSQDGADLPYLGGGKRVTRMLREAKATLNIMGIEIGWETENRRVFFHLRRSAQTSQSSQSGKVENPGREKNANDTLERDDFLEAERKSLPGCEDCEVCAAKADSPRNGNGHTAPPLEERILEALGALGQAGFSSVSVRLKEPPGPVRAALERLRAAGKVRAVRGGNYALAEEEALG